MGQENNRYSRRGVSSQKEDVHKAVAQLDKGIFPNTFCRVFPDDTQSMCMIPHADGTGSKAVEAYQYWKETGDMSVWKGVAIDAIVMNLDDLLCCGVTKEIIYLTFTIGRNKFYITSEVIAAIIAGAKEFVDMLNSKFGMRIIYAGGETADLADQIRTIVIDANMTVRMRRRDVIVENMKPGNVIVSLASFGKANYEDEYNSGLRSNGITSARHDMQNAEYGKTYPETVEPKMDSSVVYCGDYDLVADAVTCDDGSKMTLGKFMLSPTRTYAPIIIEIIKQIGRRNINGFIHCSGGGQTKIGKFVAPNVKVVKDSFWDKPRIFRMIQEASGTSSKEMPQTYNSGGGMDVILPEGYAQKVIAIAKTFNVDAKVTGYCTTREETESEVVIHYDNEVFDYKVQ